MPEKTAKTLINQGFTAFLCLFHSVKLCHNQKQFNFYRLEVPKDPAKPPGLDRRLCPPDALYLDCICNLRRQAVEVALCYFQT